MIHYKYLKMLTMLQKIQIVLKTHTHIRMRVICIIEIIDWGLEKVLIVIKKLKL